jgi:hypothetical protein
LSILNWVLVMSGGVEACFSSLEAATAAGEKFLLGHPSECRVVVYESGEDGDRPLTRMIFHWQDECFHYLEAGSEGPNIDRIYSRPCPPSAGKDKE